MPLVAGIDSSTQSCKVVVRDASSGALVRAGRAPHPEGTEVDPQAWLVALERAVGEAGGLDDVASVSIGAQQHGMVLLDEDGEVVRPALLWNDTRSAEASRSLVQELGGPQAWISAVGSVPVASFTVSKLRWIAEHEPESLRRTAAVCLPHDWLTWKLSGARSLDALVTDRGDASGTGYWAEGSGYREDLLQMASGTVPHLPRVLGPRDVAGTSTSGAVLGPGTGDNAAAALGLGCEIGDVVISLGTSGVASAVVARAVHDASGTAAGFADATGRFLPLVCTMNGTQVLDATARLLGVSLPALSELALSVPSGSDGLVLVPYLNGERTPDRPLATGSLHGLTLGTTTPAHVARAAVEGIACGLADAVDALVACGVEVTRVLLIGGGAQSEAVRSVLAGVLGRPVLVPQPSEYVADGAARQAGWVLSGDEAPPTWPLDLVASYAPAPAPGVRERYREGRDRTLDQQLPL